MDITVTVPDECEAEFREFFQQWLSSVEEYPIDQTVAAAAAWWDDLGHRERDVIATWIDAAPNLVSGADIVTAVGLEDQNRIRGVLSWLQRKGERVGFDVVWKFTVDRSGRSPQGFYGFRSRAYADLIAKGRDLSEARQAEKVEAEADPS